ncbi:MAG: hypothetical protein QUS13_08005 [Smithella sp.]|nr:hypothetical protein [Smithella sp.]
MSQGINVPLCRGRAILVCAPPGALVVRPSGGRFEVGLVKFLRGPAGINETSCFMPACEHPVHEVRSPWNKIKKLILATPAIVAGAGQN